MTAKNTKSDSRKVQPDRWGYFARIQSLLSAFEQATTGQKVIIVAMGFVAAMFTGLGLVGSVVLPAWAVVTMFLVAILLIVAVAAVVLFLEQRSPNAPFRCRQVPIYPLDASVAAEIAAGLDEIRRDASEQIRKVFPAIPDNDIRANIFLLAQVRGGPADGEWRLVIPDQFALNMRHPPERNLQFSIGQGAAGIAFRDGAYQLTRRQSTPRGNWPRKNRMTPELEAQVHKNLKWIVTFPLLRPDTSEAVAVLNVDSLDDVADDEFLNEVASSLEDKVKIIARLLSLQPSNCIGLDNLGVLEDA